MEQVNVIVGRFQPFTLGHIKGAEYVLNKYKLKTVFCIVETPESKLDKKHPFPSDLIIKNNEGIKEDWFAGMFPIKNADIGKIAQVCREHNYEPIMWTCGSDRVDAYKKQAVEKYINMYNLDPTFQVVEIPRTDDDISATKVRNAVLKDDFDTFKRMMPEWSHKDFDSYKPFIKEAKTTSLYKYITEGFFGNVGAEIQDPEDWFSKIAINASGQYLTKYNQKNCIRDNKKWTITFLNDYKKDNKERELTLDLKPYMETFLENDYDPSKILVELSTGLYQSPHYKNLRFKHQERIDNARMKGVYFDDDKVIKVEVTLMPGSNPRPDLPMINGTMVNKMLQYTNHTRYAGSPAQHRSQQNRKRKLLLKFGGYLNDYPFGKDNFIEFENHLKD